MKQTHQDVAMQAVDQLYRRHSAKLSNLLKESEIPLLSCGDIEQQFYFFSKDIKNKVIKSIVHKSNLNFTPFQKNTGGKNER